MDRLKEAVARVQSELDDALACRTLAVGRDDLRTILDALPEWRGIEEHNNSRDLALVVDAKGKRAVAWRHHPSSRTDEWLTEPGRWQIKPVAFIPLPPPPAQETGG